MRDGPVVGQVGDYGKIRRGIELAHEIAAEVGLVMIHDDRLDVVHIKAQGIAEQQDQQQRNRKGQIEAAGIPDQMIEFLACNRQYSSEVQGFTLLFFHQHARLAISVTKASFRSASGLSGQDSRMMSAGLPVATILPSLIMTMRPQWRASSM